MLGLVVGAFAGWYTWSQGQYFVSTTPGTTGDVVAELPLAQSTVSEHLRILREAGLIQGEIEGPRTRYCVNATGLAILKAGINAL